MIPPPPHTHTKLHATHKHAGRKIPRGRAAAGGDAMAAIHGIRATAVTGLICSILACFCVIAFDTPIPGGVMVALFAVMLVVTAIQAEVLYTAGNFCGSGAAIEGLLYDKGSAIGAQYGAMVLLGMGLVTTAIIRLTRPDCFAKPAHVALIADEEGSQEEEYCPSATVAGVPVETESEHHSTPSAPTGAVGGHYSRVHVL
jgi:hypothetical protein